MCGERGSPPVCLKQWAGDSGFTNQPRSVTAQSTAVTVSSTALRSDKHSAGWFWEEGRACLTQSSAVLFCQGELGSVCASDLFSSGTHN